jgi:hypothetical protein
VQLTTRPPPGCRRSRPWPASGSPAEVIVVAVRWYLRYDLSYRLSCRDVEQLLATSSRLASPAPPPWLGGIDVDDYDGDFVKAAAAIPGVTTLSPNYGVPQTPPARHPRSDARYCLGSVVTVCNLFPSSRTSRRAE